MRLFLRYFLSVAILVWAGGVALADHMNGTYAGTGDAQGVTLQLQQSGRTVNGQFSGAAQGSLSGQSDGGDNVTGTVELTGAGQFKLQAKWSQQGILLTLTGQQGSAQYTFLAGGAAPTPPPAPQPPPQPAPQPPAPPAPPATDVQYFLIEGGTTAGPFSLDQVKARLADGRSKPADLIWKAGLAAWVAIETLAEFSANNPPPAPGPTPPAPPAPPAGKAPGNLAPGFPGRSSG